MKLFVILNIVEGKLAINQTYRYEKVVVSELKQQLEKDKKQELDKKMQEWRVYDKMRQDNEHLKLELTKKQVNPTH